VYGLGQKANETWIQTLEVATARVYNWDVGMRRKEKAEGKTSEPSD
jgi:hypothetical protein